MDGLVRVVGTYKSCGYVRKKVFSTRGWFNFFFFFFTTVAGFGIVDYIGSMKAVVVV